MRCDIKFQVEILSKEQPKNVQCGKEDGQVSLKKDNCLEGYVEETYEEIEFSGIEWNLCSIKTV